MERMQMERMLATPADAEIILKLYDLRRETLMREARAWVIGRVLAGNGRRVLRGGDRIPPIPTMRSCAR